MHIINAMPKIAEDRKKFQLDDLILKILISKKDKSNTEITINTCPHSKPTLKANNCGIILVLFPNKLFK